MRLSTRPICNKVKIFHFISGDLWAGAEVMAFNLLNSLRKHDDLDVQVILLNQGRLADELQASGIRVHIISEKHHHFYEIYRNALTVIGDNPPNIIHSHRYKENFLAYFIKKKFHEIKLISTLHGLPEIFTTKSSLGSRIKSRVNYKILSRYFHKTVAVSSDIRETLINNFGFADERVEIIRNGIQIPHSETVAKKEVKPFVIGSSGRLFPVKDYPLMIEIANSMTKSDNADIRFEIAGDGPELSALKILISRYGLQGQFSLRGHLDDMQSFYQGLDLYLNTSVHEGIPMAILESIAYGLPIVASNVGGIKEIIKNGQEGFLIEGRNPMEFAKKCLLLYRNTELRKRMSEAARNRAEEAFSAERMAKSYHDMYLQNPV